MCKESKSVEVKCDNCCEDTVIECDINLLPEVCPMCGSQDIDISPVGESD